MTKTNETRRHFLKKTTIGTAALTFGGILPSFGSSSYSSIIGSNERIRVAVMGVNSRGLALAKNFASQSNCEVAYICDVDSRASEKCVAQVVEKQRKSPKQESDIRKLLEFRDFDALVVATPDHWHAPAAILASQAGKHVYLEKPASHNPREGELLVAAQRKYGNVIQMGNQRRSWPNVMHAIQQLHSGIIGTPFYAKSWYSQDRPSIGVGKEAAIPGWLDYELWQGPAPRQTFKDNLIHYNWHWFWNWGTGEALNNGTHMIDIARWGLQVDYPTKVSSVGGNYRHRGEWETPDTQVISLEFGNKCTITWEGRSSVANPIEGSAVGVLFYGEGGALQIDGSNSYKVFDTKNNLVREVKKGEVVDVHNLANPSGGLDANHIQNFFDGIKNGSRLNADILSGHISTLLVQLGNIAQRTNGLVQTDPSNGHILDNPAAQALWGREYEKGWEPVV